MSETLLTAFGLVLVFEGLTYAIVPGQMKRMMAMMQLQPDDKLRIMGTMTLAAGVFLVWLARTSYGG